MAVKPQQTKQWLGPRNKITKEIRKYSEMN